MNSDQLFKEKNDNLTRSQRRLLEYILSNDQESVFLKIKDLAKRVNVSQATVVRLSRALGFKGFPEFQQEMRLRFRNKLMTTSRLQRTVNKARDEGDVLIKVLQTDINNIAETLKLTSIQEFKRFVHKMDSAQRVVIVGIRSAHALAIFLGIALEFLQKDVLGGSTRNRRYVGPIIRFEEEGFDSRDQLSQIFKADR